ncbi:MAG: hypothetical protein IPN76_04050 [Saprospiraceae bacterium]|nr:hypothetical protein [Saprospiraceae bacterium]
MQGRISWVRVKVNKFRGGGQFVGCIGHSGHTDVVNGKPIAVATVIVEMVAAILLETDYIFVGKWFLNVFCELV